jgi:hypothetical protein
VHLSARFSRREYGDSHVPPSLQPQQRARHPADHPGRRHANQQAEQRHAVRADPVGDPAPGAAGRHLDRRLGANDPHRRRATDPLRALRRARAQGRERTASAPADPDGRVIASPVQPRTLWPEAIGFSFFILV